MASRHLYDVSLWKLRGKPINDLMQELGGACPLHQQHREPHGAQPCEVIVML